ncbi:MAG TPA: glycosyltransferase family 4 protein [Terracidiphilus sp.]|nr:glycosyltransferase family 4 protein [Terracidiphilus sp.]
MSSLVDEFVARGHKVTVITTVPHYNNNQIWPEYLGKLVHRESSQKTEIYRLFTYVAKDKANLVHRALAYGIFHVLSLLRMLILPRHDILLVPSPPLSNGVIANIVRRFRGTPFIYNVQDIWPDVIVRAGAVKNESAIRHLERMENYVYRHAAHITVLSDGFRKNLLNKGVPSDKITVIPNFVDSDFITPQLKDNTFSRQLGLQDKFIVLFAGNMGFSQGLETVLDTAKMLQANEKMEFLMVGNGAGRASAEEYLTTLQLHNVRFLPYQPREMLPYLYGSADVCVIPLRHGFAAESVPSKLFTIMGASKPAIAAVDRGSEIWRLLERTKAGICVEPENPASLAEAILHYYLSPDARRVAGENGRKCVEREFCPKAIADRYLDVMHSLVDGEKPAFSNN